MKYFLTLLFLSVILIKCTSKNNLVVTPCDTCGVHTDTSKKDTTKVILDTVPVSITILAGDQTVENIARLYPIYLSVIVKNKAGLGIKGISVSFTAALSSGSVSAAIQNADDSGRASTMWTLSPQTDSTEELVAKVMYNNTELSVRFHASVVLKSYYNFIGTLTMDTILQPMFFQPYNTDPINNPPFTGLANNPDPFTIPSDPLALSNGIPYPFELDSLYSPVFQPGEHGEGGKSIMKINHFVYPLISVSYEVGGLIIIDVTATYTFTDPEPFTVKMAWEFRSGSAYLLETVSSPTRGTFTNGRTGTYK